MFKNRVSNSDLVILQTSVALMSIYCIFTILLLKNQHIFTKLITVQLLRTFIFFFYYIPYQKYLKENCKY
jgi:hypothetical protein